MKSLETKVQANAAAHVQTFPRIPNKLAIQIFDIWYMGEQNRAISYEAIFEEVATLVISNGTSPHKASREDCHRRTYLHYMLDFNKDIAQCDIAISQEAIFSLCFVSRKHESKSKRKQPMQIMLETFNNSLNAYKPVSINGRSQKSTLPDLGDLPIDDRSTQKKR